MSRATVSALDSRCGFRLLILSILAWLAGFPVHAALWIETHVPTQGSTGTRYDSVTVDAQGNVITAGLDVVKYDEAGNELWKVDPGMGPLGSWQARAVAVGGSGGICLTGQFSGAVQLGSFTIDSGDSNVNAIFVAKLSSEGTWLWAKSAGASSADFAAGNGIAVDANENVYVTGSYQNDTEFGTYMLTGNGFEDIFVAKLNANGVWQWAKKTGSLTNDDRAIGIAVEDDGTGIYVSGFLKETSTFGATTLTKNRDRFAFIAKMDALGNWLWAKQDATSLSGTVMNRSEAVSLCLGPTGLFVLGKFDKTFTIDGQIIGNGSNRDNFVLMYDRSGALQWVQFGDHSLSPSFSSTPIGCIAVDNSENLWWVETLEDTITIGGTSVTATGSTDALVVKMDADGYVQLLRTVDSSETVQGHAIAANQAGNAFLYGTFSGTMVIDGQTIVAESVSYLKSDRYLVGMTITDWMDRYQIGIQTPTGVPAGLYADDDFDPPLGDSWSLPGELTCTAINVIDDAVNDTAYGIHSWIGTGDVDPASGYGGSVTFDIHQDSTLTWDYKEFETYEVGQSVIKPDGVTDEKPVVYPADWDSALFFNLFSRRLFVLQPIDKEILLTLEWNLTAGGQVRTYIRSDWPESPQIHLADSPEIPLYNSESQYFYLEIAYQTSDATDTNRRFLASEPGYAVLHYSTTDSGQPTGNLTAEDSFFEVVLTHEKEDLLTQQTWQIGTKITDPEHDDPGKTGWVFNELAHYDGNGPDKAYNRETRTGRIIPVNLDDPDTTSDDLLIFWYQKNDRGVSWSVKPVLYDCFWPDPPLQIVIASAKGSEYPATQPQLDPAVYPSARVYHQGNRNAPGFNPNEEHAFLAPSNDGNPHDAVFALRSDLNDEALSSEPYALLKYWDSAEEEWDFLVYAVFMTDANYPDFSFGGGTAGTPVQPPYPLSLMQPCVETDGEGFPYWQDYKGVVWAKAAGMITTRFFYPLQSGFDYDIDHDGTQDEEVGTCVPWLDRRDGGTPGTPIEVEYPIAWPSDIPELKVGETLLTPKRGLPNIMNQAAVKIIYDEIDPDETDPALGLAALIEPLTTRWVDLAEFPDDIPTENQGGMLVPTDVPYHIKARLQYDPAAEKLGFKGFFDDSVLGDPILLLNVMTPAERGYLRDLTGDQDFKDAIDALYVLTINPRELDLDGDGNPDQAHYLGLQDEDDDGEAEPLSLVGLTGALTAGEAAGTGYLTLAFNDDASLDPLPVSLEIIRVECGPYLGELKIIESDNVFDERLVLRHVGDFGGRPELFDFEWYTHPDETGSPPLPLPDLENGQANGWLHFKTETGGLDATIEGASLLTLSDNWVIVRFKPTSGESTPCQNDQDWSDWVGGPGTEAQLAEGWIKRVTDGLDPFETRVKDFHKAPANTFASMILQAGERYEGAIAFNGDPDNLNDLGFIETYETVLRRGKRLSIDGTPPVNYDPANTALLNVGSRIAELYAMLGNEAYADASDPTIGFSTHSSEYGTVASSIFTFQNQLDSLLSEELVLLRGRDDTGGPIEAAPIYNHLVWNFTNGDGELAYATSYGIYDANEDGVIDEFDARIQYPQGHGDAWGQYLTAIKTYYGLLRHPEFDWNPRVESINVGGAAFQVDYFDERKFAKIAAARAKVGAEIVNLAFRDSYDEDPTQQFLGYPDSDPERAWGVIEWGRRAGQAAYFDWLTANAVVPHEDTDYDNKIEQIDRSTVSELRDISSNYYRIEERVDEADAGLNPLGLAKGAVPFDIDPSEVDQGKTHFEQVWERANDALENSVTVFNHANEFTQSLRKNQDTLEDFSNNVDDKERDYINRLIEIFGYPFSDDIGAGRTYPDGFDGPDLYHYQYVDRTNLTGEPVDATETIVAYFNKIPSMGHYIRYGLMDPPYEDDQSPPIEVEFNVCLDGRGMVKPDGWTGARRAQGELQRAISEIAQAKTRFDQAKVTYENHLADIDDMIKLIHTQHNLNKREIRIRNDYLNEVEQLDSYIDGVRAGGATLSLVGGVLQTTTDNLVESLPTVVGLATDVMGPMRLALRNSIGRAAAITNKAGTMLSSMQDGFERKKLQAKIQQSIDLETVSNSYEVKQKVLELTHLIREEATLRLELFTLEEIFFQAQAKYDTVLARGMRLIEEMIAFRKQTAAEIQEYRYEDMAFRIFRNDALQKYRAQFDLTARYAYLAATAYDYETNLLGNATGGGREFLTDIVKQRNLGQVVNAQPVAGTPGLADTLARLKLNFDVLKGQLGFNNPQTETNRFSLRTGMFRVSDDPTSDAKWVTELEKCRVDDLWEVPEFRRFCQPFAPESAGPQPGLVIPFGTTVTFSLNFFAEELGGGDSAYDPTHFSTKVRSAGVWFTNYDGAGLSLTPRVYLVPVGADVLRSPTGTDFETREWNVVDQVLPVPFPVGATALSDPEWIPINDTLNNDLSKIRRSPSLRAYHDSGEFDPAETVTDTRLIGRSVWNTRWLLIIPGGTLLFDADEGLDGFIYGPGLNGDGIKDIKIFFQTYAYAGLDDGAKANDDSPGDAGPSSAKSGKGGN